MDTNTQIERLIELAIVQRTELKRLVDELPQLKEHLNAEIERTFEEAEPQMRAELEEFVSRQTADRNAQLGTELANQIASLAKALEESAQAKFSAILAARDQNADLLKQAESRIADAAANLPSVVKELVTTELARFPRAGEIDQLRKEFAEPRGLNPRGKWLPSETYNKLDLVTFNGDSYVSNIDGNKERPTRTAANWTLNAARGASGGGGGITSLNDILNVPTAGQIVGSQNGQYVPKTLVAGANITINETASAITIIGDEGQISLQDGTAAAPSLFFTNDTDTGLYRPAANTLGISVSGTQVAYFDANGLTVPSAGVVAGGSFHGANGNANNPSLSFSGDQDTGFFRHQPNEIGITLGGVQKATLTSTTFTITPNLVVSGTGSINGTSIPASKTLVVTTDKLSALASTSSSELAGVISDETGTGALVFANTPTLVTPNIGAATGTSVNLSGNATVGGTLTVSGGTSTVSGSSAYLKLTSTSASKTWDLFADSSGPFYISHSGVVNALIIAPTTGNATLAGNLTVSGTGTSSVAGVLQVGPLSPLNQLDVSKSGTNNRVSVQVGTGDNGIHFIDNGGTRYTIGSSIGVVAPGDYFAFNRYSGSAWSEMARFAPSGNVLLGTTTDGGQKLQVAGEAKITATSAAGGIGGLYIINTAASSFGMSLVMTGSSFSYGSLSGANSTWFNCSGTPISIVTQDAQPINFLTNYTTALTLDSSQRCILAGALRLNNAYTAGAPTATGYVTLQDSAGNTYKVLVGT